MLHIIVDNLSKDYPKSPIPKTWWYNLLKAYGVDSYANFLALSMGLGEGFWQLVSPVTYYTTHNDSLIVDVGGDEHAFAAFSAFVAQDKWQVYQVCDTLWLLKSSDMPEFHSSSIYDVYHQSAKPFLDAYPLEWRRLMTETQMLFHHLSTSINGIWLWGQGQWKPMPRLFGFPKAFLSHQDQLVHHSLIWNTNEKPKNDDCLLVFKEGAADIKKLINQSAWYPSSIHWWFENTDYITPKPTLWGRFKNWCAHAN